LLEIRDIVIKVVGGGMKQDSMPQPQLTMAKAKARNRQDFKNTWV